MDSRRISKLEERTEQAVTRREGVQLYRVPADDGPVRGPGGELIPRAEYDARPRDSATIVISRATVNDDGPVVFPEGARP